MRSALATLCLALALAGCRGTGSGLFGQMTIPPPGTQPSGTFLAGNSYYPGTTAAQSGSAPMVATPTTPTFIAPRNVSQSSTLQPNSLPPESTPSGGSLLTDRRGASLSRANLAGPARTSAPSSREDPIRIPDDPASTGKLAAVIPIRGIPTTDATGLFAQIRSQLTPPATLAAQPRNSSGFVEISQLRNPPAEIRRAALSQQQLR